MFVIRALFALGILGMSILSVVPVWAHCEIPCGIYDDESRFKSLAEDITTIEKSIIQINELSPKANTNMNQIVRWVENKDRHADQIKETVATYFLSQRVKVPKVGDGASAANYEEKLKLLHRLTVAAMRAKQTSDLQYVTALRKHLADYKEIYDAEHAHKAS